MILNKTLKNNLKGFSQLHGNFPYRLAECKVVDYRKFTFALLIS